MLTIEKDFPFQSAYPLSRLGVPERLLFFDIETTGFSGSLHQVYLIGAVFLQNGRFRLIQWFADTKESEPELLDAFFGFLKRFDTLVHFNGDTFDLPFLKKRCEAFRLDHSFEPYSSVDIYRLIKPCKKQLGLSSLKQKAVEAFLGISREDRYSGGELIAVYEEYIRTKKQELLRLLLLHNEDDLKGMPALLPILFYPDFFTQEFTLLDSGLLSGKTPRIRLSLRGKPDTVLPVPLKARTPSYALSAEGDRLELSLRLYEGSLKYYYPNYKDYYYLIYEDTAIHKSVGAYVDPDARVKATRETCYTRKSGRFLPQPSPIWTPEFKNGCRDKACFFEYTPDCFKDQEKLNRYLQEVMAAVFAG